MPRPGAYTSGFANIGGNGHDDNPVSPAPLTGVDFRGARPWKDTVGTGALYPAGKGRLNVAYDQHSLVEHATENTSYKNATHIGTQFENQRYGSAVWNFGRQVVTHDSGQQTFVPHFDPICTSATTPACDNITGVSLTQVDVGSGGGKKYGGWDLDASSSTGKNIHVLLGGRHLGWISSGGTFIFRWSTNNGGNATTSIAMDIFHASSSNMDIWLVSEDGGSAKVNAAGRALPKVEVKTNTVYPGTTYPPTNQNP
jgi:hypothetical protein